MKEKNTWILFAGDRKAWQGANKTSYRWRVFVGASEDAIYLKSMSLRGEASEKNNRTGWRKKPNGQGVIAWISYYGDIEIKNGAATITLKEPPRGS
ncbi:MAG: hypothetical protein OXT67_06615 [Zetaproteobacteria bacterium]|nr:hypothetical protein [Zetaproteobacteria bacterium]